MITVRVAASAGLPRNTPQPATSPLGAQRAAGMKLICTVVEPLTIGTGGPGGGGCAMPPVMTPVHAAAQVTYAAGKNSIIVNDGGIPASGGAMMPHGASKSWVTGSPMRAAG